MSYPRLQAPPIDEVVCGFIFDPLPLDAMDFGIYWHERKVDYPKRELHPALREGVPSLHVGVQPLRAWLIAASQDLLIQLQFDRFFMNWRRRSSAYPHFSDHGDGNGLKRLALAEFARFAVFTEGLGHALKLRRVELTKIDVLVRGKHYEHAADLTQLLRVAAAFRDVQIGDPAQLSLRFAETTPEGNVQVSIVADARQVRIETHVVTPQGNDTPGALAWANERCNRVFFGLIEHDQLHRFGTEYP